MQQITKTSMFKARPGKPGDKREEGKTKNRSNHAVTSTAGKTDEDENIKTKP